MTAVYIILFFGLMLFAVSVTILQGFVEKRLKDGIKINKVVKKLYEWLIEGNLYGNIFLIWFAILVIYPIIYIILSN
jgi:hypothetical protein